MTMMTTSLASALVATFATITVVGHRGAPAELPESTLGGFARARSSTRT